MEGDNSNTGQEALILNEQYNPSFNQQQDNQQQNNLSFAGQQEQDNRLENYPTFNQRSEDEQDAQGFAASRSNTVEPDRGHSINDDQQYQEGYNQGYDQQQYYQGEYADYDYDANANPYARRDTIDHAIPKSPKANAGGTQDFGDAVRGATMKLEDEVGEEEEEEPEKAKGHHDHGPPVSMPAAGHTTDFPRKDNVFEHKESIPYDEAKSLVWQQRDIKERAWDEIRLAFAHFILGIMIGTIAFVMDQAEDFLVKQNRVWAQQVIDKTKVDYDATFDINWQAIFWPCFQYAGFAIVLGSVASAMTNYYGPGANGSGVAELIGYVNGVNYPRFMEISTLLTKIVGVDLAVSARLCVGKEGPLAHIGSICGSIVAYIPGLNFEFLRNDAEKRMLITAGSSAGVAAAFGAPIGGSLFTYEMSKSSEFQTFPMIWRTFITCAFAVLTLDILLSAAAGDLTNGELQSATKFGTAHVDNVSYTQGLVPAIVLGMVGGAMGAFFINVNFRVNACRKMCLKGNCCKVFETAIWAMGSATIFFVTPFLLQDYDGNNCEKIQDGIGTDTVYQAWCKKGEFDKNAALFWSAEGEVIRNILNVEIKEDFNDLLIFMLVWYILTITTYGTSVPAGLFLPGMIIGCCLGKLFFKVMDDANLVSYSTEDDGREKLAITTHYIIIGVGAFMAGYTRMTFSLGVILMETSQTLEVFVPMLITIFISNRTGYLFTRGLYERATRGKQMPILVEKVPEATQDVQARHIMSEDVVSLRAVTKVKDIMVGLESEHHGFPVLNMAGVPIGLMPRNYLLTILEHRGFYIKYKDDKKKEDEADSADASQKSNTSTFSSKLTKLKAADRKTTEYLATAKHFEMDFPPMPQSMILDWKLFTRDFWSLDMPINEKHRDIGRQFADQMVDLRPYLVPNPTTVFTTDVLPKCLLQFRFNQCRHMMVIHPRNAQLKGVITRQDLFNYMDL